MRAVKLFISSTFSDFEAERDILHTRVFPRLERLCRENGYAFQAIDLRWGISAEDGNDYTTLDICLREVQRCQHMTPRPNFLLLAGDRYGWKPLPTRIEGSLADRLLTEATHDERAVLLGAYAFDENALTREMRLFSADEATVIPVLAGVAARLSLSEDERQSLFASATHRELLERLKLQEFPSSAVCAVRTLERVPEDRWSAFFDVLPDGTIDEAARASAEKLKETAERLAKEPICYTLDLGADEAARDEALASFASGVESQLETFLRDEFARAKSGDAQGESSVHVERAHELDSCFAAREEALLEATNLLTPSDGEAASPLVIVGPSGSGKSHLMAALACRLGNEELSNLVVRFVGLTGASSNSDRLLADIAGTSGESAILIDGVDGVDKPRSLVAGVLSQRRMAPVVLSMSEECLELVRNRLPEDVQTITLARITKTEAAQMVDARLAHLGRTLDWEQRGALLDAYELTGDAHYLGQLVELAASLSNRDGNELLTRSKDLRSLVVDTLDDLIDRQHFGPTITQAMVAFLLASRSGLTDDELFGLLSDNPEVRAEFEERSFHKLPDPSRGLPYAYVSRLFYALLPLLSECWSEGEAVYRFGSGVAEEAAREWCGELDWTAVHGIIADYFLARREDFAKDLLRQYLLSMQDRQSVAYESRYAYELPGQLLAAERFDDLYDLLRDRAFLIYMHDWGFGEYLSSWAALEEKSDHTIAKGFADLLEKAQRANEGGEPLEGTDLTAAIWVSDLLAMRGGNASELSILTHARAESAEEGSLDAVQAAYHEVQSLLDTNQRDEALAAAERLYRETPPERSAIYCDVLYGYGQALYRLDRYEEAQKIFKQYYELATDLGARQHCFVSLKWIASCEKARNNLDRALELYEKLEDQYGEDGDLSDLAPIYFEAATATFMSSGDEKRARELFDRCDAICERLGNRGWLATVYATRLSMLTLSKNYHEILELFPRYVDAYVAMNPGKQLSNEHFEYYVRAAHDLNMVDDPKAPAKMDVLRTMESYAFLERCGAVTREALEASGIVCKAPELYMQGRDLAMSALPECLRRLVDQREPDVEFFATRLDEAWQECFPMEDVSKAESSARAVREGHANEDEQKRAQFGASAATLVMAYAYSIYDRCFDEMPEDGIYSAFHIVQYIYNQLVITREELMNEISYNEYRFRSNRYLHEIEALRSQFKEMARERLGQESEIVRNYVQQFGNADFDSVDW